MGAYISYKVNTKVTRHRTGAWILSEMSKVESQVETDHEDAIVALALNTIYVLWMMMMIIIILF